MALDTTVEFLGVNDCKVYKITADTSTTYTVEEGVDIPIKSVSYTPEIESKSLYQDEKTYDRHSSNDEMTIQLTSGSLSQEALKVLMGGTVSPSGSTPNQVSTYGYNGGVLDNYVQIAFQIKYVSGAGDMHFKFMKAKVENIDVQGNAKEYGEVSITLKGIPTTYEFTSGQMMQIVINETATALAATVSE